MGEHLCEIGTVSETWSSRIGLLNDQDIFTLNPRKFENTQKFTAVLLVPTGIGAELGGHAGDAGALAKLVASSCDKLITHPNVVNASDINELPENGLYVEGSVISGLLTGTLVLQEVRTNRILLITEPRKDRAITDLCINAASAARASMGIDCVGVVEMADALTMESIISESGCAVGHVDRLGPLFDLLVDYQGQYDAVALHTGIEVPLPIRDQYLRSCGEVVNPWGGVEAMLTHLLSLSLGLPTAHAPMVSVMENARPSVGIVDPRLSAEMISSCYLICVLKGLHRSPKIIRNLDFSRHFGGISVEDISCLIIPDGCVGIPTLAAMEQGIPVIAVRENRNRMRNDLTSYPFRPGKLHIVENYLEAVGVMNALKAGVSVESVRRPLSCTRFCSATGNLLEETPLPLHWERLESAGA
jgi:hypothetical protein